MKVYLMLYQIQSTAIIDVTDIIKSNINLNSLVESSSFPNNETPYQITSSTIKYRKL